MLTGVGIIIIYIWENANTQGTLSRHLAEVETNITTNDKRIILCRKSNPKQKIENQPPSRIVFFTERLKNPQKRQVLYCHHHPARLSSYLYIPCGNDGEDCCKCCNWTLTHKCHVYIFSDDKKIFCLFQFIIKTINSKKFKSLSIMQS